MVRYTSNAEWPRDKITCLYNITSDTHDTRRSAEAVCSLLEMEGYGGEGKIFPVRTWVEVVKGKRRREPRANTRDASLLSAYFGLTPPTQLSHTDFSNKYREQKTQSQIDEALESAERKRARRRVRNQKVNKNRK